VWFRGATEGIEGQKLGSGVESRQLGLLLCSLPMAAAAAVLERRLVVVADRVGIGVRAGVRRLKGRLRCPTPLMEEVVAC
jgi:hypothetical protein